MKKFALLLYLILITCSVQAQEGKNQIGIAAEAGIPMGNFGDRFKTSVGGSLKGLYGIGKNGQVTFTTGFMRFKSDGAISRTSIIPFLGGYRHNLANGIYLEPQLGYGIYKLRHELPFGFEEPRYGAFTYAMGVGFAAGGFDAGVRYQSAGGRAKGTSASVVRVGYNFTLGGSK